MGRRSEGVRETRSKDQLHRRARSGGLRAKKGRIQIKIRRGSNPSYKTGFYRLWVSGPSVRPTLDPPLPSRRSGGGGRAETREGGALLRVPRHNWSWDPQLP